MEWLSCLFHAVMGMTVRMSFDDLRASEFRVRLIAARHLARVADENSQDVGSAFRSGFEMPLDRARTIADLHELSPLVELPQPVTELEREYLATAPEVERGT
jgi:hypothetical protein